MSVMMRGNDLIVKLANGSEAEKWIIPRIYESSKCATYAKGIEIIGEINPSKPAQNAKNIVSGIRGRIRILVGSETIEKIPVV